LEDIPEDIDIPPQPIAADADAEGLGFLSDLQGLPDVNSVSVRQSPPALPTLCRRSTFTHPHDSAP
jgi:hypothetical protein